MSTSRRGLTHRLMTSALSRTGELGPVKTPKPRRSVLLSPKTAALFAELVAGKQPGEMVFSAPEGGPWDAGNMRYRYWRLAVAAAQRCALHAPLPEAVEKADLWLSRPANARPGCTRHRGFMTCGMRTWRI